MSYLSSRRHDLTRQTHNLTPQVCSDAKFTDILDTLKKNAQNSPLIYKHSACLMKNGKIFGIGFNKYYGIKLNNQKINLSIHAEMNVMLAKNAKHIRGMDILIIRISSNNKLQNSRPCNTCIDKMKKKGIRKAYYSNSDGNIVYEFIDDMPKLHQSSGNSVRIQQNCIKCM